MSRVGACAPTSRSTAPTACCSLCRARSMRAPAKSTTGLRERSPFTSRTGPAPVRTRDRMAWRTSSTGKGLVRGVTLHVGEDARTPNAAQLAMRGWATRRISSSIDIRTATMTPFRIPSGSMVANAIIDTMYSGSDPHENEIAEKAATFRSRRSEEYTSFSWSRRVHTSRPVVRYKKRLPILCVVAHIPLAAAAGSRLVGKGRYC